MSDTHVMFNQNDLRRGRERGKGRGGRGKGRKKELRVMNGGIESVREDKEREVIEWDCRNAEEREEVKLL